MAEEQVSFMQSLKNLMTNRNFIFLLLSYGINVGVFYAISTLLNPVKTADTLSTVEQATNLKSLSRFRWCSGIIQVTRSTPVASD